MESLLDPRKSAGNSIVLSLMLLLCGASLSVTRLQTVVAEAGREKIARYRSERCRIVGGGEKLELGAFYYQPFPGGGEWLSEGEYLCDLYGNSGRIERNGSLQHFINAPPEEINKVLKERMENPNTPDSNPSFRPLRDRTRPAWIEPEAIAPPDDQIFQP